MIFVCRVFDLGATTTKKNKLIYLFIRLNFVDFIRFGIDMEQSSLFKCIDSRFSRCLKLIRRFLVQFIHLNKIHFQIFSPFIVSEKTTKIIERRNVCVSVSFYLRESLLQGHRTKRSIYLYICIYLLPLVVIDT